MSNTGVIINILVSEELRKKMKVLAYESGKATMSDWLRDAIYEKMARQQKEENNGTNER